MNEWREFTVEELDDGTVPFNASSWAEWDRKVKILTTEAQRLGIKMPFLGHMREFYTKICAARALEAVDKNAKAFVDSVL